MGLLGGPKAILQYQASSHACTRETRYAIGGPTLLVPRSSQHAKNSCGTTLVSAVSAAVEARVATQCILNGLRHAAPAPGEAAGSQSAEEPAPVWAALPSRYQLSDVVIGAGHFGKVFLGTERAASGAIRKVAIKVIQKRRSDMPLAQHMSAIQNEVHIMTQCANSSSVVRLEGVYEDEECVYMVQELCVGGDLRAVIRNGLLSESEAAHVMRVVLDVIHECHTHHYSYGDVKPANFLLKYPHHTTGCTCVTADASDSSIPVAVAAAAGLSKAASSSSPSPSSPHAMASTAAVTTHPHLAVIPQPQDIRGQPAAAVSMHGSGSSSDGGSSSSSDGGVSHICTAVMDVNTGALDMRLPLAGGALTQTPVSSRARTAAAATAAAHAHDAEPAKLGGCDAGPAPVAAAAAANNIVPLTPPASGAVTHATTPAAAAEQLGSTGAVISCRQTESGICAQASMDQLQAPAARHTVTPAPQPKMLPLTVLATDFGCAQPLSSRAKCTWAQAKRVGSPVYMAPELWQGVGSVGLAIDVWAAGVMLYQLLSGRYPFWPMNPDAIDSGGMALYQVVCGTQSNPVILSGAPWDNVSKPCKDLIMAMLERDPEHRITALRALQHPWMTAQLGHTPLPTSCVNPYASLGSVDADIEQLTLGAHVRTHLAAVRSLASHQVEDLEPA